MTPAAPTSFEASMALATRHQQLQMWRAAQTVSSHIPVREDRQEVLDCLGLSDVVRPADL
jgi:hypothetical protein